MSKCQKNKYFIGTCSGPKTENKAFQQDFSKLMAARDALDSQLQAKPVSTTTTTTLTTVAKVKQIKEFSTADVDIVLKGDF